MEAKILSSCLYYKCILWSATKLNKQNFQKQRDFFFMTYSTLDSNYSHQQLLWPNSALVSEFVGNAMRVNIV